jgi:xanthine dehydrogenase accessory factor
VSLAIDDQGVPTLRERVDEPAVPLWLYGAGHVGRALVRALAELPFEVTWIDSRQELLGADVPSNTRAVHSDDPVALARQAPATAYHLVMTHDHGLDFDLCHAILTRGEFAWHGLIGSASKAAKFRSRLVRAGVPAERVARLVSPIGIGGLTSKLPAAIAASVTVQLLQQLEHVAERAVFHTNTTAEPRKATLHDAYSGVRDWTTSHDACSADDCRACRNRQVTSR